MTRLADRPIRDRPAQPGPLRGRRDRAAPRGGRRGRWLARLRRDRSGRRAARASSTASSACSRRPASSRPSSPRSSRTRAPSTVERGAAALRAFGLDGTVVVAGRWRLVDGHGQGARPARRQRPARSGTSSTTARTCAPGRPVVAVPTTAGTGAETNIVRRSSPTRRPAARATSAIPSLLPVATILDPALTVGLPPAATAATGVDAMTHSLESLLSANPNPFAEAMALGVIRTVGTWLRRAVADGSDLEARSQMLMASHLAGRRPGERDRRRARPRAGPLDRDARPARRTGPRSPPSSPRSSRFYLGRARPRARARRRSRSASRRAPNRRRPAAGGRDRRHRQAAPRRRPASDASARSASTTPLLDVVARTPSTTRRSATRRACPPWRRPGRSSAPSTAERTATPSIHRIG